MNIENLYSKYVVYKFENTDIKEIPIAAGAFIIFMDAKDLVLYVTDICTMKEHQH